MTGEHHVIVVGGGFAGVGCARRLAKHHAVRVTLLDRHNYQQFQPLLYQVATSQLPAATVGMALRAQFMRHPNVDVKYAEVTSVDLERHAVTTSDGLTYEGDALVLAAGGAPNFFGTKGAEEHAFPLYSLRQALALNIQVISLFEEVDRRPGLLDDGLLTFVVVGGGATGTETAGALADMIRGSLTVEYADLDVSRAKVILVDHGPALLAPFSERAHRYAAKALERKGVEVRLESGVQEVAADRVVLADGTVIPTRCVIWGGGIRAAPLAAAAGLPVSRGGRVDAEPDLRAAGHERVYVVGDVANIPDGKGGALPQLGSVALQSGTWAADNLQAQFEGRPTTPFRYRDKGIMAMIGRGAAVAEMGPRRWEVHGFPAFVAWLGVHALLMPSWRTRFEATLGWAWDYLSRTRGPQLLPRPAAADPAAPPPGDEPVS
jgi:NADH dehydrogenase